MSTIAGALTGPWTHSRSTRTVPLRSRAQWLFPDSRDTFPVPVTRLSTIVILVGLARVVPLPPPLGIVLGALLTLVGVGLRRFTEN